MTANRLASLAPLTARTLLALGRFDEVEHYAFWGRDVAHLEDLDAQMQWRVAISGSRSHQGRHDEAIALARESVTLLAPSGLMAGLRASYMALARALRAAGDEAGAVAAAHEAERLAATRQDVASLPDDRGVPARLMAAHRRYTGASSGTALPAGSDYLTRAEAKRSG